MNDLTQVPWYENALILMLVKKQNIWMKRFWKSWNAMRLLGKGKSEIGSQSFNKVHNTSELFNWTSK